MAIKVALTPADIERRVAASHASPERLAQFAARMRAKAENAKTWQDNFSGHARTMQDLLHLNPHTPEKAKQVQDAILRRQEMAAHNSVMAHRYGKAERAAQATRAAQPFSEVTPQHLDALRKAKLRENVADIDRKALAQVIQEQAGLKQKIRAAKGEADGIMQRVAKDPVPTPAPLPAPAPAPKGYGAGHLAAGVAGGVGLGLVGGMLGAKALGKKREAEGA